MAHAVTLPTGIREEMVRLTTGTPTILTAVFMGSLSPKFGEVTSNYATTVSLPILTNENLIRLYTTYNVVKTETVK
jgi:hypothetical protein